MNVECIVYRLNSIRNAKLGDKRNEFTLTTVDHTKAKDFVLDALDAAPNSEGAVLIKFQDKLFLCSRDVNQPNVDYIRQECIYHPFAEHFSS